MKGKLRTANFENLRSFLLEKKENAKEPGSSFIRTRRRQNAGSGKRLVGVYIGLDFGTSFTKAFFRSSQGDEGSVEFNPLRTDDGAFFLPSRLYYDAEYSTLRFTPLAEKQLILLEFFKYGMLKDELKIKDIKFTEDFSLARELVGKNSDPFSGEYLCSVYFLANCFKYIKEFISEKIEVPVEDIRFRVNMGCPFDNLKTSFRKIYDDCLRLGWILSKDVVDGMDLADVYALIVAHRNDETDIPLQTIPELYAEVYHLFRNNSTKIGLYGILDIGGGTADFAVFHVRLGPDGSRKIRFLTQNVLPLGVEMLCTQIYPKNLEIGKKKIRGENADIVKVNYGGRGKLVQVRERLPYDFRCGIFGKIVSVKKMDKNLLANIFHDDGRIPLLLYGGGADFKWYQSIIKEHNPSLKNYNIPILDCRCKKENKNRLIIAKSLAFIQEVFDLEDGDISFSSEFVQ